MNDTASTAGPASITVRAAAKINLHLGVGAPREDGFHPLDTVYQAVSLYDDVTVTAADDWSLTTVVDPTLGDVDLPGPGENIVDRVADLMCAERCTQQGTGACSPHGRVEISKAIPVAGGMAGGSADAAAAFVALDRLWDLDTPDDVLLDLAARLGSDIPFSLIGGTARGVGRGEIVTPIDDDATWAWVVVPAVGGLSTPAVYRHFDAMAAAGTPDASPEPASADRLLKALATGDPHVLATALHNDLQAAAIDLRPDLGDLIDAGEAAGALRGMVSGSGPTCVFLCASAEDARDVAGQLRAAGHTALTAHGPVAGAHVLS